MSQEEKNIKMLTDYGWFKMKTTEEEAKQFIIDFMSNDNNKLAIQRGNHQKPIAAMIKKLVFNGNEIKKIMED